MDKKYSTFVNVLQGLDTDDGVKVIPGAEVVRNVTALVMNAEHSICMTMLLSEELANPLPDWYHDLIQEKLNAGITITRVAFGTAEEFAAMKERLGVRSENYTFIHVDDVGQYQRMNLIDNTNLFFKLGDTYYRTTIAAATELAQIYIDGFLPEC